MTRKNGLRKTFLIVALGAAALIFTMPLLLTLFVLWQPAERYDPKGLAFKQACEQLQGSEYTFENIDTLKGNCLSSKGVERCKSEDLPDKRPQENFRVSLRLNAGASEGYQCWISVDEQNQMNVESRFVAID